MNDNIWDSKAPGEGAPHGDHIRTRKDMTYGTKPHFSEGSDSDMWEGTTGDHKIKPQRHDPFDNHPKGPESL